MTSPPRMPARVSEQSSRRLLSFRSAMRFAARAFPLGRGPRAVPASHEKWLSPPLRSLNRDHRLPPSRSHHLHRGRVEARSRARSAWGRMRRQPRSVRPTSATHKIFFQRRMSTSRCTPSRSFPTRLVGCRFTPATRFGEPSTARAAFPLRARQGRTSGILACSRCARSGRAPRTLIA